MDTTSDRMLLNRQYEKLIGTALSLHFSQGYVCKQSKAQASASKIPALCWANLTNTTCSLREINSNLDLLFYKPSIVKKKWNNWRHLLMASQVSQPELHRTITGMKTSLCLFIMLWHSQDTPFSKVFNSVVMLFLAHCSYLEEIIRISEH